MQAFSQPIDAPSPAPRTRCFVACSLRPPEDWPLLSSAAGAGRTVSRRDSDTPSDRRKGRPGTQGLGRRARGALSPDTWPPPPAPHNRPLRLRPFTEQGERIIARVWRVRISFCGGGVRGGSECTTSVRVIAGNSVVDVRNDVALRLARDQLNMHVDHERVRHRIHSFSNLSLEVVSNGLPKIDRKRFVRN